MSVPAVRACQCYWKTTNKQETVMQEHWTFILPLYKHESMKKWEEKAQIIFSSHFIFTLQKCDCWQGGGQKKSKCNVCVCQSNDSKTSLTKHRKAVKGVKRIFQGKILFCLSGSFLCNGKVHAAIETAFPFWRQGRKEAVLLNSENTTVLPVPYP